MSRVGPILPPVTTPFGEPQIVPVIDPLVRVDEFGMDELLGFLS
jgi:hypothetical protein